MCCLVCVSKMGAKCMGHGNHLHTQHECKLCLLCVGLAALYHSFCAAIISDRRSCCTICSTLQPDVLMVTQRRDKYGSPAAVEDLRRPIAASRFLGLTQHAVGTWEDG